MIDIYIYIHIHCPCCPLEEDDRTDDLGVLGSLSPPGRALWRGGITIGFVVDGVLGLPPHRILQWFTNHPILGFEDASWKTPSWKFGNRHEYHFSQSSQESMPFLVNSNPSQTPKKFINSTKPKPGNFGVQVYAHQADWTWWPSEAVVAWCAFAATATTTCCFIWDWVWLFLVFFSFSCCRCERIACQWDSVSFTAGKDVCMLVKWLAMTSQKLQTLKLT